MPEEKIPPQLPGASPTWTPSGGAPEGVDSHGKGYLPPPWTPPPRPENLPPIPERKP
jgi:hypothetical protein